MPVETGSTREKLTRREALKRGAALGGALLWTTPAVQAIGMGRAYAQETSGPCTTYCIKFEFTGPDDSLAGDWVPLGGGTGNCFVCPADGTDEIPAGFFDGFAIVGGSRTTAVTIRFPNSCSLAEADSTPDEFNGATVAAKCGSDQCNYQTPAQTPGPDSTTEITVDACGGQNAISHIEIIIRCCS